MAVLTAIAILIVLPRGYASEAKLIVKIGRESVALDPTATTSQTMTIQKTQEEEINSALEILHSRKVKEAVVNDIGVDAILSGYLENPDAVDLKQSKRHWVHQRFSQMFSDLAEILLAIGVRDPVEDYERAIIKLEKTVHVFAPKKTQVISIYAEAKSPQLAQRIVDSMSSSYLEQHMLISQTSGSYEFFKRETENARASLEKANFEMAQFMAENQIVSVASNQDLLKNAWNGILGNVLRLEREEQMLASSYSATHPRRLAVIEQLKAARAVLIGLKAETGDRLPGEFKEVLDKVNDDVDAPVTEEAVSMIGKISELIMANSELETMLENVRTLESQLTFHRKKFEEARMIRVQQESSISNISVFQPATFNQKPVSPNKALVCAATLFFSYAAAFSLGLWRETKRRSGVLRKAGEIERALKLPVVAVVPVDRTSHTRCKSAKGLQSLRAKCHDAVHTIMQSKTGTASKTGERPSVVVGVLSVEKGNGGSTLASALAACCAKDFRLKTLLVDADTRTRSVSTRFSLNGAPGLHELISDEADVQVCLQRFEPLELSLIASTNKSKAESTQISFDVSHVMKELKSLSNDFEVVIVDLPPASEANNAVFLATRLDCVLLVAESAKTTVAEAIGVLRKFETSETEVCGLVLNKYRREFPWESSL